MGCGNVCGNLRRNVMGWGKCLCMWIVVVVEIILFFVSSFNV